MSKAKSMIASPYFSSHGTLQTATTLSLARLLRRPQDDAVETMTTTCAHALGGVYIIDLGPFRHVCQRLHKHTSSYSATYTSSRVLKYGCTKDIARRLTEHRKRFGPDIVLVAWAQVGAEYMYEAEMQLKVLYDTCFRPFPEHSEVVCVVYTQRDIGAWRRHLACIRNSFLLSLVDYHRALEREKKDHEMTKALYTVEKEAWAKEREVFLMTVNHQRRRDPDRDEV